MSMADIGSGFRRRSRRRRARLHVRTRGRSQSWRRSRTRIRFSAIMLGLAFVLLSSRLAVVAMTGPHDGIVEHGPASAISGDRIDIVDRRGTILATNTPTSSLYVHPRELSTEGAIHALERLPEIFPELNVEQLERKLDPDRKFAWIKRQVSPSQERAVVNTGLAGMHFGQRQLRIYPKGTLASHVLGGTKFSRESVRAAEIAGVAGVELGLDSLLRDMESGSNQLMLSIDHRVQSIVEQKLAAGVSLYRAKAGSAVLMDVRTGEIVSLASHPDFDPNRRSQYVRAKGNPLFNIPVQGIFEFGSVFKVFAAAQALDLGLVHPETPIETTPVRINDRTTIRSHYGREEPLTVEDTIVKSSNPAAARLALMIGKARQQEFMQSLGFLDRSPLELAESSIVKPMLPDRWSHHSVATISYGHGLAVSAVHLAAAYATISNGGCRVVPTISPASHRLPCERVISPRTSRQITDIMRQVVQRGTASKANLPDIAVGGKTGTADKPNPKGGYHDDRVLATFAAVFPTEAPKYVLILSLDEPNSNDGSKWERSAGNTAVPVAAEIISSTASLLLHPSQTVTAGLSISDRN